MKMLVYVRVGSDSHSRAAEVEGHEPARPETCRDGVEMAVRETRLLPD